MGHLERRDGEVGGRTIGTCGGYSWQGTAVAVVYDVAV